MGYRMAKNLRSKLPSESVLVVSEIVEPVLRKFMAETKGQNVRQASSPKEVSEQCASIHVWLVTLTVINMLART